MLNKKLYLFFNAGIIFAFYGCDGRNSEKKSLDNESESEQEQDSADIYISENEEKLIFDELTISQEEEFCPDQGEAIDDNYKNESELSLEPVYPIIFVHGNTGGLEDWRDTINWLIENDERWDSSVEAGTESSSIWSPHSIPASSWLFNFTYYNRMPEDERGAYTAGPGTIGSNFRYWCNPVLNWGYIPSNSTEYYNGVVHEYSADLAEFIGDVLRATGAWKVDIVAHSMGGLVARSTIQFYEEYLHVRRLMLVSSPIHGEGLVDLAVLDPWMPRWMIDHEFAELDDAISFWDIGFYYCDESSPVVPWHEVLNASDDVAAEYVTYYVIVGEKDPVVSLEDATYDHAQWELVVPEADHNTIRTSPQLLQRIVDYLGN